MSQRDVVSPQPTQRSADKQAWLEKRLRKGLQAASSVRTIPRHPGQERAPLSFAQQRLWFLYQIAPDDPFYNISRAISLSGKLDIAVLQKSLDEIVRRHQALRTAFAVVEGQPLQIIAPPLNLPLPLVDLTALPMAECKDWAWQLAADEARRPFDLTQGPLLRTILLQLDAQTHLLLLTMHHIVSDGWSVSVLFQELETLYEAFAAVRSSSLSELPVQYADFALWQREWLQGQVLETQLSYWQEHLQGAPAVLELPTDHPRPAVQTFRGKLLSFALPDSLTGHLRTLSQQQDVTLFMTLLAAFKTLLHRYTGQDDLLVSIPVTNRNRPELEGLIGFFVNTLVLHTDLSGNPTFEELLMRVRQVALGAYSHQDLPFEKLVEELHPERTLSHQPLFQVMFAFQNAPSTVLTLPGLTLSLCEVHSSTAKTDLTLFIDDAGSSLTGLLEYNTDLFETATVERLLGHFQTLLQSIVANPQQRLSNLALMTDVERHKLLIEWNDTQVAYPQEQSLHRPFEAQAEHTPDAVALIFQDQFLTYGALNARANQLAHYLLKLGTEPQTIVGICMARSPEMLVGQLGILKAGGAYLPLDPTYPKERLAFTLLDTQAAILLTEQRLLERLPQHHATVVCLDTERSGIAQESHENPTSQTLSENLAYIIYTSGSTGKPKGVAIRHKSAVALIHWAQRVFDAGLLASVLASTSISFDLSIFELFVTLSCGGTVILAETALHLPTLPAAQAVTLINIIPSAMRELLRLKGLPSFVRGVNLAGEPLQTHLVQQVYAQPTIQQVFDLYGPSEDTTYSTCALRGNMGPETIGHPVANTKVYLLDAHLNPVPVGVFGELCLGGAGLARGYLYRPTLTAEKFIPHPFNDEPGARLYRTGDLARYLPDGNIEFLGRSDYQVKIRGYRIELGEVEAALVQHPAVQEAVILAREDEPGNKYLAAYVVPAQNEWPASGELRNFLKAKLPEYMIPAAFTALKALPLTANGKIDRRVLPAPDAFRSDGQDTFVALRTPIEELLTETWADILGQDRIGIHDNFFDLGGHSLLATQVISRVRDTFQIDLGLRSLFEAPTIAGLAHLVEMARQIEQKTLVPPIQPVPPQDNLPLSFAQQRLWFLEQFEPASVAYNISAVLHLTGPLDVTALERSLNEIVNRHQVLRTTFSDLEGQPHQVIAPQLTLALPLVDLCLIQTRQEAEGERLAIEEAQLAFDLLQGPLLRTALLRLGNEAYILLLTMHHIVSDGWSMNIFFRELAVLYATFATGSSPRLPDLTIQYADFAVWQRHWLQGEVLKTQLAYWKQKLEGTPAVLELPTDRPRPTIQSYRGARQTFYLPRPLTEALKALSRHESVTLFMTLLAAFQTLLHRYTSQDDIVVGSPIANRHRAEIEGLIGFFANTLVLRTHLSGNPSFRKLLAQVRETTLEAYTHQDLPFEKLVEELQPERSLSHSPLFQVMVEFQGASKPILTLADLKLNPLAIETKTAKFELGLSVEETPEGLKGSWSYNTDLFNAATVAHMAGHLETLLQGIVAHPDQPLSNLPLLPETERHRLLAEWNSTQADYATTVCLHHLFEAQAERTPDATAVVFETEQLSYAVLNRRANQLAHYLQELGVKPEVLVGVCVERSVEMVIAILGTLKAGGAYIPLDPAYPQERLAFMLENSQTAVLLTQHRLVSKLDWHEARAICLDTEWQTISQAKQKAPDSNVTANNLAYVIYTSGSTGKPKGVQVLHQAVVNFMNAMRRQPGLMAQDKLFSVTTLSFDIAALELFLPITTGACVGISSRQAASDNMLLAQRLTASGATIMQATPATWRLLFEAGWSGNEQLAMLCGGEALPRALADQLFDKGASLWNLYGPTETTIWSTVLKVAPEDRSEMLVSIGQPIANTQIRLLDTYLNPVPIGIPGELYIGGDGLARGYLGHADLTAERFVPDPYGPHGARLYKTGDLARYLPDGNIEFLGRTDHQVKVRGFRIELNEIEAALSRHPAVQESVAVAHMDESRTVAHLIAYIVGNGQQIPTINEMRHFLSEKLPAYMIPSAFVTLEALPLTPSGKVDRRALPAPDASRPELEKAFVAPRSPVEEAMAGIWTYVLGVEQIGVHDNFFDLGGHSLLATQAISRINKTFRVALPLRSLFEAATVAELSQVIVANEVKPGQTEQIARLLKQIDSLPLEAIKEMLHHKR